MNSIVDFPENGSVRDQAAEWLIHLDGDRDLSEKELEALGRWLNRSPAHQEELLALADTWNDANILTELAALAKGRRLDKSDNTAAWWKATPLRAISMMAAVTGMAFIVLTWWERATFDDANGTYVTAVGQQKTINLPDGSSVELNTDSEVSVQFSDDRRDVYLYQGEAHFVVAKDVVRAFQVQAGHGQVLAVGTEFSVRLLGEEVEVLVSEGMVQLGSIAGSFNKLQAKARDNDIRAASESARDGAVEILGTLGAGQVGVISVEDADASTQRGRLVANEVTNIAKDLAWRDGILMLTGESLETVVAEMNRYTRVTIEVSDPELQQLRVGGRLPIGETEAMLQALETNFGLQVSYTSHDKVLLSAPERD